jgi:hypothetical protein
MDITDLYSESKYDQISIDNNFSESISQCNESRVVGNDSNDYDNMLASIFDISESEILSSFDDSNEKKATVIAEPHAIGTPDPQLATFNKRNTFNPEKPLHETSEITVDRPTMPTEADAYEVDLTYTPNDPDLFVYEAQVHKNLFSKAVGTTSSRIYCNRCRCAVMSQVGAVKRSFWSDLFAGIRCCTNPSVIIQQELVHSCSRCGNEL